MFKCEFDSQIYEKVSKCRFGTIHPILAIMIVVSDNYKYYMMSTCCGILDN